MRLSLPFGSRALMQASVCSFLLRPIATRTFCSSTTVTCAHATLATFSNMARTFFVGGNWKMNGSLESTKQLTHTLTQAKLDPNVGK